MKKTLAILLSAMLLISFTACGNKPHDDYPNSNPTSTPGASQDENQNDTTNSTLDNSQNNSQNNSQGSTESNNSSTIPTPEFEDTKKEDITVYIPYSTGDDDNSQYFPPEMDSTGAISPGVTVQGKKFEVPEFFEVSKAIRICKAQNAAVTLEKLAEFANEYAKAYNKYYTDSNYKLTVSLSGNVIKYTFTVSGTPAERTNYILQTYINKHFNENTEFYNSQAKKFKDEVANFDGIQISIVRADNDTSSESKNVVTKKFS